MLNAAKQQKAILDNETWWNIILICLKVLPKFFITFPWQKKKNQFINQLFYCIYPEVVVS